MKRIFYFSCIATLIIVCSSCRKALKDVNDYFPTVKTVSATITEDGAVLVTGRIEDSGEKQIEYAGFCWDTVPEPKMLANQAVVSGSGEEFTHTYTDMFNPQKTYYFRSWATNGNGYSYGDIVSLTGIAGTSVTPPCTLTMNYLDLGTGSSGSSSYVSVGAPGYNINTWDFTASSWSSGTLHFKFGSKPRTKVFDVVIGTPNANQVSVHFYYSTLSESIEPGNKVYVIETSPGVYDMTLCQASWKYNSSSTFYLNTRFTCPF